MNPVSINIQPQELAIPTFKPEIQGKDSSFGSFKETLTEFVESVNHLQSRAAAAETSFLKGEISDVHQVMIAVEEASVAFELLMEIRNKLLESYQQIVRMPI